MTGLPQMVEHGHMRHQMQEMCYVCQCCDYRCEAEAAIRFICTHPAHYREIRDFIGRDGTERRAIVCKLCHGVLAVDKPGWEA